MDSMNDMDLVDGLNMEILYYLIALIDQLKVLRINFFCIKLLGSDMRKIIIKKKE
jgi:hypothetical protein